MKNIFLLILLAISFLSSFCNEQLNCEEKFSDSQLLVGKKSAGLYSEENQLLHVFKVDGEKYFIENESITKICFNTGKVAVLTKVENNFSLKYLHNKQYLVSILLLLFIIIISFITIYKKNWLLVFNPLVIIELPSYLTVISIFFIGVIVSYFYEEEFVGSLFYFLLLINFLKFISSNLMSILFKSESSFRVAYSVIFKIFIMIFIAQIIGFLTFNITLINEAQIELLFYLILTIFIISTMHVLINSEKKLRIMHLFYYLCALEILPVLFLIEFYL